jgi:hypothetical protein
MTFRGLYRAGGVKAISNAAPRQRSRGRGAYLAPDHDPFLNHPGQGFVGVGIIMAHVYSFNALSAGSVDGEVNDLLILLVLQPAEGSMLHWHFFVESEADAEYSNANCR